MQTIRIMDPVTRIEGHMKVEITMDEVNGQNQVVDARSTGTLFRGFETLLQGRAAKDATVITQRICGVCPIAHHMASAKAGGASNWYIITRHMIPNALSHIIVVGTLAIPVMILGESSLSFLGLGIQPPMTSLGVLLQEAQNVRAIANYPWQFTPALMIIVSILAFNFLGDGLRDAADPYR